MPRYFDVHSHLQFPQYDADREDVLARMRKRDVWTLIVGTNFESSQEAVSFAKGKEDVFAAAGLHPNDTGSELFDEAGFGALLQDDKAVAVGECGLDYYRNNPDNSGVKKRQQEEFEKQIDFAIRHNKPLMLHCRPRKGSMDAYEDVVSILREFPGARGNVHFFVGNVSVAKKFLEMGFTLSFTGVITFARDYDEVVRYVPLESILTETDAPFATPTPHRGKRNEPTYVVEIVSAIADLRGEDSEVVRSQAVENAKRVFSF